MTGQKIDGIEVSNAVKEILKSAVEKLNSEDVIPCLATVLIGDDPASATYVKINIMHVKKLGLKQRIISYLPIRHKKNLTKLLII